MTPSYLTLSDEELLVLIREQDDEDAFGELYERYFRPLFNHVYSKVNDEFSAQEIIQELFLSIWQQRHKNTVQTCRPYLFSAAKNLIISFYRKEFTRRHHYSQWQVSLEGDVNSTDQEMLTSDLQNRYEKGLFLLPQKCRDVFILSRQGLSNREIALQLVISEKTVEQHITKALRILKGHLREHFVLMLVCGHLLS